MTETPREWLGRTSTAKTPRGDLARLKRREYGRGKPTRLKRRGYTTEIASDKTVRLQENKIAGIQALGTRAFLFDRRLFEFFTAISGKYLCGAQGGNALHGFCYAISGRRSAFGQPLLAPASCLQCNLWQAFRLWATTGRPLQVVCYVILGRYFGLFISRYSVYLSFICQLVLSIRPNNRTAARPSSRYIAALPKICKVFRL